jgi:hypothetical protein
MKGIDGLKKGSPLGVEPKGEGITGEHGYSTGGTSSQTNTTPAATPAKEDVKKDSVTATASVSPQAEVTSQPVPVAAPNQASPATAAIVTPTSTAAAVTPAPR